LAPAGGAKSVPLQAQTPAARRTATRQAETGRATARSVINCLL
jgi:hypothetical protein